MTTQLRDYRIQAGRLAEFVEVWRRGVVPLRRQQGFSVDGAWTVAGQDRFVWLLSHDGTEDDFRSGDAAYYASPGRTSLDPDPAKLIVSQSTAFLRRVALDPAD